MNKIIKLQTHDGSNNYLEQIKGHVYKLVTQTDFLRGGELNNGDIFIDPSGGPMIVENNRIDQKLDDESMLKLHQSDLYGLISFIDPKIFGDEKLFNAYVAGNAYEPIKEAIKPVVQRTLRRDVGKYLQFKKRTSKTFDFCLGVF